MMSTKYLVYTALMTAIIAVLGFVPAIPLPIMPVPIVLQNIGIFLAAILLGRKYGTLSVVVLLLLVVAGLPLLSGGRGGIGVLQDHQQVFIYVPCYYISYWSCKRLIFEKDQLYCIINNNCIDRCRFIRCCGYDYNGTYYKFANF